MAAEEKWYFTKEQLANTPSRKFGTEADKELSNRQQAANFIQDMGQRLQVTQLCINTAIVYMHRFYVYHSFTHFHRNAIATAALFLAAKVEEQPRKLEHVIKVAHVCLQRQPQTLDTKSDSYLEQAQDLVFNENVLLQTLSFDVAIDHPHTHVVRCCHMVKASKDLAQTSYFMASNSLHLTTMCLQYKPTVVACFCIHLACKWSNWEIPQSNEGKDWFTYVDASVTFDQLETLTTEFLQIFDKCPTKLKRKIMSITATQNAIMPSQATQGSVLFDNEPRKIAESAHSRHLLLPSADDAAAAAGSRKPAPAGSGAPAASKVVRTSFDQYKEKRDKERQEREHKVATGAVTAPPTGPPKEHLPRDGHHHKPHPSKPHAPAPSQAAPVLPPSKMAPPAYYPRPAPATAAPRPAPKAPSFSIFSPPPVDDAAPAGKANHTANDLEANRHHSDKYNSLVKDSRHSDATKRPHGKDIAKPLSAEETQRMFGAKPNHKEAAAEKRTTPERHDSLKRPAFGQPAQLNPTAHLKPLRTPSPVKAAPPAPPPSSSHHAKPHHRPTPGRPGGHPQTHPSTPSAHPSGGANHAAPRPARPQVAGGTRTPTAPAPQHRTAPTPPVPHRGGQPIATAKPGEKPAVVASKPAPSVGPVRPKSPRQLMPGGAKVESRPRSPRVPPVPAAAAGSSAHPGLHAAHPASNSTHLGQSSTHLAQSSTHLGQNSTHLGSNSSHLGPNSTLLGSNLAHLGSSAAHLGANSSTHLGSNSSTHLGANSSTHLGANSSTHLGANSLTHLGAGLPHLAPTSHARDSRNGGTHPAERRDVGRVEDPHSSEFINVLNVTPTKVRPPTATPGSSNSSSSAHRSSGSKPSSRHATPATSRKPADFVLTPLAPMSPDFGSPPKHLPLTPGASNNGKNRNRTTSSSSEPELVPYIMKIEDIAGYENVLDSQEGFKLSDKTRLHDSVRPLRPKEEPKLLSPIRSRVKTEPELLSPIRSRVKTEPELLSPIRSRVKDEPSSPAKPARPREDVPPPVKQLRTKDEPSPPKRIKEEPFVRPHLTNAVARPPETSRSVAEIAFAEPPTFAAATEPELANGAPRESFIDVVNDSEADFIKNMIEPSRLVVMPTPLTIESPVKSEHRHKSEKKKKKEKHKHKERDKDKPSREERKKEKKKHKEKTKEREAVAAAVPLPSTPGIKITIPKEKILATTIDASPAGLKIKISKDRLKESGSPFGSSPVSTPVAGGGLKLKISKDIIDTYTTPMATKESRKRQSSRPSDEPRPAKAPRVDVRKPAQNGVAQRPPPPPQPHGKAEYAGGATTGSHAAKKPPP